MHISKKEGGAQRLHKHTSALTRSHTISYRRVRALALTHMRIRAHTYEHTYTHTHTHTHTHTPRGVLWPEIAFHLHAVDSFSFLEDLDVDMFGEDFLF